MHIFYADFIYKCACLTGRGFSQISLSSEVSPMIRMVARGGTTCVDAYLTPVIKRYLASFCKGFDDNLRNVNVSFMQSDGGHSSMPQVVYIHTYIYLQV